MTFDSKQLPTCINNIINDYLVDLDVAGDCDIIKHFNNIEDIIEDTLPTKYSGKGTAELKYLGELCVDKLRYYSHESIMNDFDFDYDKEVMQLLFRNGEHNVNRFYFPIENNHSQKYFKSIVSDSHLNRTKTVGLISGSKYTEGEYSIEYTLLKRYRYKGVFNKLDFYKDECREDKSQITWQWQWSRLTKGIYYHNHYSYRTWKQQVKLMKSTNWWNSIVLT